MEMQQNIMPRFETEALDGKVNEVKATYHKDGKGFEYRVEAKPAGYMVFFPRGHSIRVRNTNELKRLGFHKQPGLVDMDSGDIITPDQEKVSLKEMSARKTKGRGAEINPVLDADNE
jgi:hypothetical protein